MLWAVKFKICSVPTWSRGVINGALFKTKWYQMKKPNEGFSLRRMSSVFLSLFVYLFLCNTHNMLSFSVNPGQDWTCASACDDLNTQHTRVEPVRRCLVKCNTSAETWSGCVVRELLLLFWQKGLKSLSGVLMWPLIQNHFICPLMGSYFYYVFHSNLLSQKYRFRRITAIFHLLWYLCRWK